MSTEFLPKIFYGAVKVIGGGGAGHLVAEDGKVGTYKDTSSDHPLIVTTWPCPFCDNKSVEFIVNQALDSSLPEDGGTVSIEEITKKPGHHGNEDYYRRLGILDPPYTHAKYIHYKVKRVASEEVQGHLKPGESTPLRHGHTLVHEE